MKKNKLSNALIVALGALISCALWGMAFPAIKIGYSLFDIKNDAVFSQILFAGCRFFLAGVLAFIIGSALAKKWMIPKRESSKNIVKLSMLQTVLQYFFFYVGLAHTSGVKASIIEATNVFFALIVACTIYRMEKLTSKKIIGTVIGFAGVIVVNLSGANSIGEAVGSFSLMGEGFILLSTISYAFSSVKIKEYSKDEEPFALSAFQFMTGGVILSAIGLIGLMFSTTFFDGKYGSIIDFTNTNIELSHVGILMLLAMISAVAYSIWGVLLKHNPVSRVSVYGFMTPVFGVIFSMLLLQGEKTDSYAGLLVSLVLITIGTILVQKKENE